MMPYPARLANTLFRILFSGIFIVAGFTHILATSNVVNRLAALPSSEFLSAVFPLEIHVIMAGAALIMGGIGLALGFWTRLSALILLVTLIPITLTVQLQGAHTLGPLFKNIALIGGLIYFASLGTYGFSLDQLIQRKSLLRWPLTAAKLAMLGVFIVFAAPLSSFSKSSQQAEQSISTQSPKVVLLVRKANHLKVGIQTLEEGFEDNNSYKDARIIFCGKEVSQLKKGSKLEKELERAKAAGVQIFACGLSLEKFGVKKAELHPFVQVTPNGLKEMIRLKTQGYIGVDL